MRSVMFKHCGVLLVAFICNYNCLAFFDYKTGKHTTTINHSPEFSSSNYTYSISEKAAVGSSAGAVPATDDDGDNLTYSFKAGNTNSTFKINSVTGSITVLKRLDHHTQEEYKLTVKVTDPGGLSDEALVTINVQEGATNANFTNITWGTAKNQTVGTHEIHGEVVNGKLYMFGGYDVQKRPNYTPTRRCSVYDPNANTWSSIANLPHNPYGSNFGGITHNGLTTDNTDIYFAGGYPSTSNGSSQSFGTKEVWRYNVGSNTYSALPGLPVDLAAGQLRYLKGKIHYFGGANKSRQDVFVHYALDLDNLSAGWKSLAPVLNARNHGGSVVYHEKIYFIGGSHDQNDDAVMQKTVEIYDPNTNSWKKGADMPVARDHVSSSVIVIGDRILVLGGESSHGTKSNLVSAYSPATNTWQNLTPLPVTKAAGVACVLNGNIHYIGGNYSDVNYKGVPVVQGGGSIRVDNIMLINADTDQPIQPLVSGDILNLATLPTKNLNIRALTDPGTVGSVLFNLTGAQSINVTENNTPYALFGDNGPDDYKPWTPSVGNYTLKITPHSALGASGTAGSPKTVSFTVVNSASQSINLLPQADAFVRNGSYANTNYGSDTLVIKGTSSTGYNRFFYLRFSVPDIQAVKSAKIRLYGFSFEKYTPVNISVYGVQNDSWVENKITFNNAPAASTAALRSTVITTPKYYELDVTNFVHAQPLNDNLVSFLVKDPANLNKYLSFNSKEMNQNPPQLVIEYENSHKKGKGENVQFSRPVTSPVSSRALKSKVYPNPVYKKLVIEFAKNHKANYDLQIVDPVGRIYELGKSQVIPGAYNAEIDISKLSLKSGMYFLRISHATGQTEIIKFMAK